MLANDTNFAKEEISAVYFSLNIHLLFVSFTPTLNTYNKFMQRQSVCCYCSHIKGNIMLLCQVDLIFHCGYPFFLINL